MFCRRLCVCNVSNFPGYINQGCQGEFLTLVMYHPIFIKSILRDKLYFVDNSKSSYN